MLKLVLDIFEKFKDFGEDLVIKVLFEICWLIVYKFNDSN